MPWDTGEAVKVTGEDFIGVWRLAGGDEARDGDLNQRLDGSPLKVRGVVRVNDAGVTAVKVGVETQDVLRVATDLTVYDLPLPTEDVWTAFEAWIAPPVDQVWGRPYIAAEGSGDVDFAEIFVQRTPSGQTASDDLQIGAAHDQTWDQDVGGSVTIPSRGSPSGHVEIKSWDFEVERADSKFTVIVNFEYESSNSNLAYCWIKIGQTAPVWATSGSAVMDNADQSFKAGGFNGPVAKIFGIEGLPVGTNTLELHAGSTGSGSHTNKALDCFFQVIEAKRAG